MKSLSAPSTTTEIALVSMPFAPIDSPSLGLSLLKALVDDEHQTEIVYYGLPFADRIGPRLYSWISSGNPSTLSLVGEWLFSPALFGEKGDEEAYFELIAKQAKDPLPRDITDKLRAVREMAPAFLDECADKLLAAGPKLVGFTSVFQQHVASLALAKRLRQRDPSVRLIIGGANCEGPMGRELARRFDFMDGVVSGEGEKVFPQMVERAFSGESFEGIPGVYVPGTDIERATPQTPRISNMDELPHPDFEDFFAQWQRSKVKERYPGSLLFETSRGCWWGEKSHCTFCGLNGTGMAFRSKSAERAMEELLTLTEMHSGYSVQVVDNILDMRYFKTLLPELAKREKHNYELFYEVKANLRKEQIRLLKDAGVTMIQPGIESLSDDVLDRMGKGVSTLQNIQLLKWCEEIGVKPMWNILYGFPGEDPEDYRAMAELMPVLSHLEPPGACYQIRLDRFSPNFERGEELGFRDITPSPTYGHVYRLPKESVSDLAYHFVYSYADEREPITYSRQAIEATNTWRRVHPKSSLVAVPEGKKLVLWDLRPVARQQVTELTGLRRALYEECDAAVSLARLTKAARKLTGGAWTDRGVQDLMQPLVDDALVLRHDDKFLNLAVHRRSLLAASLPNVVNGG